MQEIKKNTADKSKTESKYTFISPSANLFEPVDNSKALSELDQFLKTENVLGFDTETTGLDYFKEKVILLSLGNYNKQFVINVRDGNIPDSVVKYLEDDNKLKIFQNGKFDLQFFYKKGIKPVNIFDTMIANQLIFAGYKEQDNVKHDLNSIIYTYCSKGWDENLWNELNNKSIRLNFIGKETSAFTEEEIKYSALDVKYLVPVFREQMKRIQQYKLDNVVELEMKAVPVFALMEYNGFYLNRTYWEENIVPFFKARLINAISKLEDIIIDLSKEHPKLKSFINNSVALSLFGGEVIPHKNRKNTKNTFCIKCSINWNSGKQLKLILGEILGYNLEITDYKKASTTKSNTSVDHKTLVQYATPEFLKAFEEADYSKYEEFENKAQSLIDWLLIFKENSTLSSKYGINMIKAINSTTNRIHTSFNQCVTTTGRISSGTSRNKQKPNLQNIPASNLFRKGFQAQNKEFKILTFDYDGAELRIIADGAKEPTMIKALNEGEDLHSYLATLAFNVPVSKTENKHLRTIIKTINFGLAYGAGAKKFAPAFNNSEEEAQNFLDNVYFKKFARLKNYFEQLGNQAKTHGSSRTFAPFYRVRWYPYLEALTNVMGYNLGPEDIGKDFKKLNAIAREGKNHPIQGTCADIVKLALIQLQTFIDQNNLNDKAKIVCQVHDEIITEVHESIAERFAEAKRQIMLNAGAQVIKSVPMTVGCSTENTWVK